MGLIYADIQLTNAFDLEQLFLKTIKEDQVRQTTVKALVDTVSFKLVINENIKNQLGLRTLDHQVAELADGQIKTVELAGPIELRFKNRRCLVQSYVVPGNVEVLLGATPMQDLDVIIEPKTETMIVNPENPYLAKKKMK